MSLNDRTLGYYPISISTSLAFEGLFGHHPENPQVINPDKPIYLEYGRICINVRTMIRNVMGSFETEDRKRLTPKRVLQMVKSELVVIEQFLHTETNGGIKPWFYIDTQPRLNQKFSKAIFRNPKTDNQLAEFSIEKFVLESLLVDKEHKFINKIEHDFPMEVSINALIITHQPIDLLNLYKFNRLALLESHTGKIKLRTDWYTKLKSLPKEITNLPFNKFTLQMFGDGTMFSPMPIKLRRYVIEIANKHKWNTTTSKEKILSDCKSERDPVFQQLVIDLFK